MIEYRKPESIGFIVIAVLGCLTGHPLDDIAMNLVDSLRPSSVRVAKPDGLLKSDSRRWRVTIYLDSDNMIEGISQEVEVGLRGGFEHGHALKTEFYKRGIKAS